MNGHTDLSYADWVHLKHLVKTDNLSRDYGGQLSQRHLDLEDKIKDKIEQILKEFDDESTTVHP